MILDQVRHDAVAAGCARASEHNRDDAAVAALDRGQKVEARSPCIAGLDTVHALDPAQQVVVIGHAGAAIAELVGRKIGVIPGETLLNGPAEDREIACGGDLLPNMWALAVIISAKWSSLLPKASAMATAISLADLVTTALMASSTAMVAPGRKPSFEGAIEAAWAETGISSPSRMRPFSSCSKSR